MRTKQTIGLIVAGCFLGSLGVLGVLIAWLGAAVGLVVGLVSAVVVIGTYLLVLGPWQRRWGATDEEVRRAMPGEGLLRRDAPSITRAVTIDASPEDVFPWLLQIGYGRGGWYSYDWIDNDGKPSADRIDPALQRLAVGDRIEMLPGVGPVVREIVPNHHIVSGGESDSWCLLVEPTPRRTDAVDQPVAAGLAEDGEHVRVDRAGRSGRFRDGTEDAPKDPGSGREEPIRAAVDHRGRGG